MLEPPIFDDNVIRQGSLFQNGKTRPPTKNSSVFSPSSPRMTDELSTSSYVPISSMSSSNQMIDVSSGNSH